MLNGDISNHIEPRLLVVFEGLIALPPKDGLIIGGRRFGKARRSIERLIVNEKMARVINDTVWRHRYSVDVVTFMGEEYLPHIETWLEVHGLPVGHVTASERPILAREMAYRLDLIGIFSPVPGDALTFGSKGFVVNPDAPRLIGGYAWQ